MPNLNQITDSINKSYVQLPDGSFAEKVVVVNSDGTAVSGGGGGGVSATMFQSPTNGDAVTITMPAPTLGKIYFYNSTLVQNTSGTISFVPTLLPNEDVAYFLGVRVTADQAGQATPVSGSNNYNFSFGSSEFHSLEFIYTGQLTFEGTTFAVYNVKHFVRVG